MIYFIIAFLIVLADQASKYLITLQYSMGGQLDLIPGVLRITYATNSGGAFSMFADHTMVLAIVSAVVCVIIIVLMITLKRAALAKLALGFILGGAIGNLIDRFVMGYVVDMFEPLFINFAVFNVADIFITVGAVLFIIAVIFFWPKKEKEEDAEETEGPAPVKYSKPKNAKDRRAQRMAKKYGPDIDETTIVIPSDEVNAALREVEEQTSLDDTVIIKKVYKEEPVKAEPVKEAPVKQVETTTAPASEEKHEFTLEEIMKEYGHTF
ncbi:MAG: signal peptidase II [Oscillospiraceae bacterium]|nr:signal peptidase II [Oscillospiraceae bacterium]